MHANSRFVSSNQDGIHPQLEETLRRHAASSFLKPISEPSRIAFEQGIAAWRAHGGSLILDAGCGVGLSTRRLAAQFPKSFVMGVDQSSDRLQRAVRWAGQPPSNFITLRADLIDFWRLMLAEGVRPERHYLLYPNPWPKKAHLGRRWHGHPVFTTVVALGGTVECRSNWKIYIDEFAAALAQLAAAECVIEPVPEAATLPLTPFEEKYAASGHALWRCTSQLPAGS